MNASLPTWLGFAAAPTFACMALICGLAGSGGEAAFCASLHGGLSLNGMGLMYGLMAVFHLQPWLRLLYRL